MKGIYLTEEGKAELDAKIVEIENNYFKAKENNDLDAHFFDGARTYLKEILASATILPVEESWAIFDLKMDIISYPQGVIIQHK